MTLTLGQGHTQNIAQYPLHHMTYASAKLEVATSNSLEEMHLQEIFDLNLSLGQGHMKHCPLHHEIYVPAKFEVAFEVATSQKFEVPNFKFFEQLSPLC